MDWVFCSVKASVAEVASEEIEEIQEAGWSRAQVRSSLADPLARAWIACTSDRAPDPISGRADGPDSDSGGAGGVTGAATAGLVTGFVLGRRVGDLLEIDLVGVRPAWRRRGAARGLLGALIAEEGRQGLAETRLELAAANEAARLLYEGLGFVVVGRRTRYYPDGDDALMLSCRVTLSPGEVVVSS